MERKVKNDMAIERCLTDTCIFRNITELVGIFIERVAEVCLYG